MIGISIKKLQQPKCTVCHSEKLKSSLSFGMQPPSNRFIDLVKGEGVTDECYRMSLGYCQQCATIQLVDRMPIDAMRPRYDWLTYNEPEGHLDDVAAKLMSLPGVSADSRVLGTTYKDQSTIDRLIQFGLSRDACIQEDDFGVLTYPFGLETVQNCLSEVKTVDKLKQKYGLVDLLIVRHIIEHAISAKSLLENMSKLLTPSGYMMLEMPDSAHIFHANNHAFIWEEHISYFDEDSVYKLANYAGAEVVWIGRYSYPYEDSLNFVLKFNQPAPTVVPIVEKEIQNTSEQLESFSNGLIKQTYRWKETLKSYQKQGKKVAIFGAGHLTVKLINFLQLDDLIECVIDDHPKKIGLVIPGSRLRIAPSSELEALGIKTCISTLSPESEAKVRKKLHSYFSSGGEFLSAFVAK